MVENTTDSAVTPPMMVRTLGKCMAFLPFLPFTPFMQGSIIHHREAGHTGSPTPSNTQGTGAAQPGPPPPSVSQCSAATDFS